jgi:hypothetical protein
MNITVSRLEQYPSLEPTGYAVGFNCLCPNGRSFYTDTVVSFDVAENDEDALAAGLEALGESIVSRCAALSELPELPDPVDRPASELIGSDVTDSLTS